MSETITYMIQQSASRVANAINKPLKSGISSPTRALMTKRQEKLMVEYRDDKQRTEYAGIGKTVKKKATEDTRKYNQEIIRETIMIYTV